MIHRFPWLEHIEVIIFDLDGTLYQDERFIGRYLALGLKGSTEEGKLSHYLSTVFQVLHGEQKMKLGYFYDTDTDLVFHIKGQSVVSGFDLSGTQVPPEHLEKVKRTLKPENLRYLGDPWSVVGMVLNHANIPESRREEAFYRVREEMLTHPSYRIQGTDPLYQRIGAMTWLKKKIVMTNTPESSGLPFVRHLGLERIFDRIYFGSGKPAGMKRAAKELIEELNLKPSQILTIGDHPWNDLAPIKELGGYAVYLSPYPNGGERFWDLHLKDLHELNDLLSQLNLIHN